MKYTINGYSQEALIKNDLDLIDSLILRTLSDMYSSNSKKIEYNILEYEVKEEDTRETKKDKDKFMWVKYGYLFEQIPIVGSERTVIRRIDKLIEKKFLKKQVINERNGTRGTYLYIAFDESYSDLTEYDAELLSEGIPNCHGGYDEMSSRGMSNWQDKDSSITDSSITSKKKNKKENFDITTSVVEYLNHRTNRNGNEKYNPKTSKTQQLIKARQKEGYKFEDFKKVIDNMCYAWKNTEFETYLRPITLFSNKFESYLHWRNNKNSNYEEEKSDLYKLSPEERQAIIKARYFGGKKNET